MPSTRRAGALATGIVLGGIGLSSWCVASAHAGELEQTQAQRADDLVESEEDLVEEEEDLEAPGTPRLVDMVVAKVDTTVITLSELVAEARLVLLKSRGPETARGAALSESLLGSVLRVMISRELLLSEARRLQLREPPESEVEARFERIKRSFNTPGDYMRFLVRSGFTVPPLEPGQSGVGRAPPGVAAILRAELQVERFIQLRIKPNVVVPSQEVQRCYEANAERFADRSQQEAKDEITRVLIARREERSLRNLIAQLERKASIRYAPGFRQGSVIEDQPEPELGLKCPEDPRGPGRSF